MESDVRFRATFDMTFPHHYALEILPVPILLFGLPSKEQAAIAIKITSSVESWTAVFGDGRPLDGRVAAFSCPNPDNVCVLSGSTAYVFNTTRSRDHAPEVFDLVVDAIPLLSSNVILLVSFDSAIGIDSAGVRWKTGRISDDDLRIVRVNDESIQASGFKDGREIEIILDPSTGYVSIADS